MTTYSEILSELRASVTNAKDYIPRLCYAAREEDPTLNEEVIRDRVKTDCIALGLSGDYVRDCIPKEFKDKIKSKAGKKGKEKQEEQKIELLADGTPNPAQTKRAENNPEQPNKQDLKTLESQKEKPNPPEDPKDTEIQFLKDENSFLKEKVSELEEALKKTQQFTTATQLETKSNPNIDDDIAFSYLQARANNTGDIIYFGRVGSGALVQALAQYKNSFGVVELFGRVVKK